jgi:NADH dehydrogenase
MRVRKRDRPRILILGGGVAGLSAALELDARRYRVTLVDQSGSFEFLPNIHELLSRVKTPELLRLPLDRSLRRVGHVFVRDRVTAIDPSARVVRLARRESIEYDALIVTIGGVDATRGVAGVEEHGFPFKTVDQCDRIGRHLTRLASRPGAAPVVIVGGGLEGVEALGEILRRYRNTNLEVTLVEARDRLMPETPAVLDRRVRELAEPYAVVFRMNAPVARIEAEAVVLGDGSRLPSELTIWTGGPTPPALLAESGLAPTGGWACVDETLQCPRHPEVFVAGDAAELPEPLPKQAYHALDMGVHAARNADRLLAGRTPRAFRPSGKPSLVSFGDLECFLIANRLVIAGPALGAAKEAIFELVMTQLDPQPLYSRLPRVAGRADRAARKLLWPSIGSIEAIRRQARVSFYSGDAARR